MSRWALEFPAFHPHKPEQEWQVGIFRTRIDKIKKSGVLTPLARVLLIPDVVREPLRIIHGWNRVVDHECYVYGRNRPPAQVLAARFAQDSACSHHML